MVRKQIQETREKEILEEAKGKKKAGYTINSKFGPRVYLTEQYKENARTIFEIRSQMLKIKGNFGGKGNCALCGSVEDTEHIFICPGSEGKLNKSMYKKVTEEIDETGKDEIQSIAEEVRQIIREREILTKLIIG